ncbi:duf229 domain containing protein [Stylonychia lemnae]|uniref:Duf229 domain containing protein n=1 Tax=Stylonychia lemnae TaxID=5949 RepID=A0A078ACQ9_STYLE|nr:duf229 domain containing protein [Stylonychia lemnae]|eukprot:CDW79651.1 duf229 domain containing protein [Stylonychia lemnae]
MIIVIYGRYQWDHKVLDSCKNWTKGLSSDLEQSDQYCEIEIPKTCLVEIIDRWQDFSAYLKAVQCEYQLTDHSLFQKYYHTNKSYIAFPLTKNFDTNDRKLWSLPDRVLERSKGFDSLQEAYDSGYESIIDTKRETIVNKVKRDEKLVQERKLLQKDRNNLNQNLLLVFTDTISRQRAHFKLPETMKYFKNQDHHEFFRLHALEDRTMENGFMFLYGKSRNDISGTRTTNSYEENYPPPFSYEDKFESIIGYFKEQGFITGYTSNICETNIFLQNNFFADYVRNTPADHENVAMTCDPHLFDYIRGTEQFQGHFSIFRRCLYGKDSFEFTFDYAKQFFKAYNQDKKIMIVVLMDMHEGTGEVINYLDKPLAKFLNEMHQDNTTVIMFSDHGPHLGGIKKKFGGVQIINEIFNPFIMTANLKGLNSYHKSKFEENQQKLITHLQFHNFLKYWASGEYQSNSLISKLPNDEVMCDFIGINCICKNYQKNNYTLRID